MSKKVVVCDFSSAPKELRSFEVKELKRYVDKYFYNVIVKSDGVYDNTLCVYSAEYNLQSILEECANCKFRYRQIHYMFLNRYELMKVPEEFFYWRGMGRNEKFCRQVFIKSPSTQMFICHYCPKNNILSTTYWTYDYRSFWFAIRIFPKIKDFLGLSEKRKEEIKIKLKKELKITIGADPEFEELRNYTAYKPVSTRFHGLNCKIGADGAGSQIEMRPKPSRNPIILAHNLKELITNSEVPISVKGDVYPLGGHIHLGFNTYYLPVVKSNIGKIVGILDDFIGIPLLPLSGKARERGGYKRLSAYEFKPWGFEYRTPPSAYLLDPKMAYITFKIARNVVKSFIENGRMVYNVPPSLEDYIKYAKLKPEEYNYFNDFIRKYSFYDGAPINHNWGIYEYEVPMFIKFEGDWHTELKEYLINVLSIRAIKVSRIVFYEIKNDVENIVSGIEIEGFTTVPGMMFYDADIVVGLPRWVITGEKGIEKSKEILEIVVKKVREKIAILESK